MAVFSVSNATPSAYYNFEITDPAGLAAAINLPAEYSLETTTFLDSDNAEGYYLTLANYEVNGVVGMFDFL